MSDQPSILPTISSLSGSNPAAQAEAWYQVYCAAKNLGRCIRNLPIHRRDYPDGNAWSLLMAAIDSWEGSAEETERQACNFYLHWDAQVAQKGDQS